MNRELTVHGDVLALSEGPRLTLTSSWPGAGPRWPRCAYVGAGRAASILADRGRPARPDGSGTVAAHGLSGVDS